MATPRVNVENTVGRTGVSSNRSALKGIGIGVKSKLDALKDVKVNQVQKKDLEKESHVSLLPPLESEIELKMYEGEFFSKTVDELEGSTTILAEEEEERDHEETDTLAYFAAESIDTYADIFSSSLVLTDEQLADFVFGYHSFTYVNYDNDVDISSPHDLNIERNFSEINLSSEFSDVLDPLLFDLGPSAYDEE